MRYEATPSIGPVRYVSASDVRILPAEDPTRTDTTASQSADERAQTRISQRNADQRQQRHQVIDLRQARAAQSTATTERHRLGIDAEDDAVTDAHHAAADGPAVDALRRPHVTLGHATRPASAPYGVIQPLVPSIELRA